MKTTLLVLACAAGLFAPPGAAAPVPAPVERYALAADDRSGSDDGAPTDPRRTSTLVLGEALDGRFFVRNGRHELVVELYKPYGRAVELRLEPGEYEVRLERESAALVAWPRIADGARTVLEPAQFGLVSQEPARSHGATDPQLRYALAGRNRIDVRFGMWQPRSSTDLGVPNVTVTEGGEAVNFVGGVQYMRYLTESLAVTIGVHGLDGGGGTTVGPDGVFDGGWGVAAIPLGVRWNPLPGRIDLQPVKPVIVASIGPVIAGTGGTTVTSNGRTVVNGGRSEATVGAFLGGGVDFHLSRNFTMGLTAGYNWVDEFETAVGGRRDYSGFELSLGFGWVFGHGTPHAPAKAATAKP